MIFSDQLFKDLFQYCGAYMGGSKGTGKTLLATAIAESFVTRPLPDGDAEDPRFQPWPDGIGARWRCFANYKLWFNSPLTPDLLDLEGPGLHHALIIIDEAGSRFAGARSWASKAQQEALNIVDYARKQRLFFITPSASAVDKKLRELNITRNLVGMDFLDKYGMGDLVWHYIADPVGKEPYGFFLWFPYVYFGTYDTDQIPGAIEDAVVMLVQEFQKRYQYDAEAAKKEAQEMKGQLESGGVIPANRPAPPDIAPAVSGLEGTKVRASFGGLRRLARLLDVATAPGRVDMERAIMESV
jgi:hypothetical protein